MQKRKPWFDVLSLQQPDDTSTSGLHLILKDSVRSAYFSFEWREPMVDLGSDGTNANKRLYELEKEEIKDHLVFTWCLFHKSELVLQKKFYHGHPITKRCEASTGKWILPIQKGCIKKTLGWDLRTTRISLQTTWRHKMGKPSNKRPWCAS